MKLNRKLVLILSLVLSLALATGGTLAYLTDRDSAANVFTIGNVDIDLNEDFEQGAELIPGVDIEKEATITNTGKNDAWVWATVAIPAALDDDDASKNVVHFNYPKDNVGEGLWTWTDDEGWMVEKDVEHEGVLYNVYTVLYQTALKPGETTPAVINNVYMDTAVDIAPDGEMYKVVKGEATKVGWNVITDGNPVMHVAAYAMQMDGFKTVQEAYAAYNNQWTTTEGVNNGIEWGVAGEPVKNADDLNSALTDGGLVMVQEDITGDVTVAEGVAGEIALQDNTLTGSINNNGDLTITGGTLESDAYGIENTGDIALNDVTVKAGSAADYAMINRGSDAEAVYENVDLASAGGGVAAAEGAQVTFKSGTVDVNSKSTSGRYLFYAQDEGSTITIEGGEFSFNKTQNQKRAYICAMDGTTVYVKGGTFGTASTRSGYTAGILTYGTGKVIITGGTFGFDPTTWVADGYTAVKNADNTWTVTK